MKKIISYTLLILALYVFNCKTISYLLPAGENAITQILDFDSEKNEAESEKPDEKNEKEEIKEFSKYLVYQGNLIIFQNSLTLSKTDNCLFIPSNYNKTIHQPPEPTIV